MTTQDKTQSFVQEFIAKEREQWTGPSVHTPGPWIHATDIGQVGSVETLEGLVVAQTQALVRDYDRAERNANTRLIAAAPCLLEALIAMETEKSDYMRRNNLGDPSVEHTNKQARAAIAKAVQS